MSSIKSKLNNILFKKLVIHYKKINFIDGILSGYINNGDKSIYYIEDGKKCTEEYLYLQYSELCKQLYEDKEKSTNEIKNILQYYSLLNNINDEKQMFKLVDICQKISNKWLIKNKGETDMSIILNKFKELGDEYYELSEESKKLKEELVK